MFIFDEKSVRDGYSFLDDVHYPLLHDFFLCMFLQEEHVPASQYNRLLEEHNHLVHTINEKSMHAASLMRSAAEKTELYLR